MCSDSAPRTFFARAVTARSERRCRRGHDSRILPTFLMLSDDSRLKFGTNCLQLIEFEATGALPLAAPKSVLQHVTNITLNHVVVVIAKV